MKLFFPFGLIVCVAFTISASCTAPKKAQQMISPEQLNGTWHLVEYPGNQTPLDQLYPRQKPSIQFDLTDHRISGHTGCNSFNGPLKVEGAKLDMTSPLSTTRMMCPGDGEKTFLEILKTVNGWTVRENELRLMQSDLTVMKFQKADQ